MAGTRSLERAFFADDVLEEHIPDEETFGGKRKAEDDEPMAGLIDTDEEDDDECGKTLKNLSQRPELNTIGLESVGDWQD